MARWTAEGALTELWAGLDKTTSNGVVRDHLRKHLQAAFEAGLQTAASECEVIGRAVPSEHWEVMIGAAKRIRAIES